MHSLSAQPSNHHLLELVQRSQLQCRTVHSSLHACDAGSGLPLLIAVVGRLFLARRALYVLLVLQCQGELLVEPVGQVPLGRGVRVDARVDLLNVLERVGAPDGPGNEVGT